MAGRQAFHPWRLPCKFLKINKLCASYLLYTFLQRWRSSIRRYILDQIAAPTITVPLSQFTSIGPGGYDVANVQPGG